jgi:hypothetical protein
VNKLSFALSLSIVATLLFVPMVLATKEGALNVVAPTMQSDFGNGVPIELKDIPQTTSATLSDWFINDTSGAAKGWHVTIQATQLTEVGGVGLKLPFHSITLSGLRSITANSNDDKDDKDDKDNKNKEEEPSLVNQTSPIDSALPIAIVTAIKHSGKGNFTVHEPENGLILTLNPETTQIDNGELTVFSTIITYSIIEGP